QQRPNQKNRAVGESLPSLRLHMIAQGPEWPRRERLFLFGRRAPRTRISTNRAFALHAAVPIRRASDDSNASHWPRVLVGEHAAFLRERIAQGGFTLRSVVAELAGRGLKVDYRTVWAFIRPLA